MKVERREQRAAAVAEPWRAKEGRGGRGWGPLELEAESERGGGSGGFKVGEGRDGERRRAEYSAAVSRLADSVFSCSECATRGRQKNGGKKEQIAACTQPCV